MLRVFSAVGSLGLALIAATGIATAAGDITATFAKIKQSIAIVANSQAVGTGFCIASTGVASYYLTNAHVVGDENTVTVLRQYPTVQKLTGTVVAKGIQEDPDLAVVRVPIGNVPALRLRLTSPDEGAPAAVAGYPSAQYNLARVSGDLVPAVHVGTVSAIVNRGRLVEYDAQTLPGNSGGPLFDPEPATSLGSSLRRSRVRQMPMWRLASGLSLQFF